MKMPYPLVVGHRENNVKLISFQKGKLTHFFLCEIGIINSTGLLLVLDNVCEESA